MKKKDTPVFIRLINYQKKWLVRMSKEKNISEAQIIRDLIDNAIQLTSK